MEEDGVFPLVVQMTNKNKLPFVTHHARPAMMEMAQSVGLNALITKLDVMLLALMTVICAIP
jgi:hypothetical protein